MRRETSTPDQILEATFDVLVRSGPRKLSLSEVAATAGVSRPTLYRWFPSKDALLAAFGRYEQEKYDAGIAEAISGLEGEERLDALLRFIVEFHRSYSLRRMVDVEPEHVVHQMARVLPVMRDRLTADFPGPEGLVIASTVTRIALSHALVPDDDLDLFYEELRHAAGLRARPHPRPRRRVPRNSAPKVAT